VGVCFGCGRRLGLKNIFYCGVSILCMEFAVKYFWESILLMAFSLCSLTHSTENRLQKDRQRGITGR
jgi:hypothetical protein